MDKTQNAVSIFDKYAQRYQDKFMDVSLYGNTFDLFCSGLKPRARILELACGPGNITRYLLNQRPDLRILATDLSQNMISLGRINNPEAEFAIMDCRDLGLFAENTKQKNEEGYAGLMCGFCLPYLSETECKQLITNAAHLLEEGGLIYLSTMEDDYEKSGLRRGSGGEEMFMHFYRAAFIVKTLEENHFKITHLSRKTTPGNDGGEVVDLILIAEKLKI